MPPAPGPAVLAADKKYPVAEESIYLLFYRHGLNPQCQKGFTLRGDLRSATERAKRHCEAMGYRYIFVRPLICDIDLEEKQKIERSLL
jgi:hypothetical protein